MQSQFFSQPRRRATGYRGAVRRVPSLVAVLALVGCAGGLRGGVFSKAGVSYRVAAPDASAWQPVSFSDNDVAWSARRSGHMLAMNAVCKGQEDAPLDVLTRHLLFGFTEKERLERLEVSLDGRQALRTTWRASLDGVPVEMELVVLKKDGCVHDLTYVSPPGERGAHQAEFEALVRGFHQEARR